MTIGERAESARRTTRSWWAPARSRTSRGLLGEHVGARRFAVISDDNVASLHGHPLMEGLRDAGLDASLFTFPAGEASKTRKSWSILTDEMLEAGFGRDSCVIAVGGGVTTDLGGFVAATFLRGVPVVQVPTSYLAMIDASVGGKTGVDVRAGKNLVGAFHAPRLVVADVDVLRTLPREERAQGLVEAFKHGAILDEAYFVSLEEARRELLEADPRFAEPAVLQIGRAQGGCRVGGRARGRLQADPELRAHARPRDRGRVRLRAGARERRGAGDAAGGGARGAARA